MKNSSSKFLPGNTVGSLSKKQHSVLIGSLLGDGALRRQSGKLNALFEVNHCYQVKDYVDWKYNIFSNYVLTPPKRRLGNGKRVAYRFTTRSLPIFTGFYESFYSDRVKTIPENLVIDDLALAVWFMDDGSKSRNSCYLNTQQFSLENQGVLQSLLQKQFGIETTLNKDKNYKRIRVSTAGTRILYRVIKSYIHPVFRYKLGNDPVTTDPKGKASDF